MNSFPVTVYLAMSLVVALGVAVFRLSAIRHNILDLPNERSMHQAATPRGAGVVFVFVWFIACIVGLSGDLAIIPLLVLVASVLVAAVGAYDDWSTVSVSLRLSLHIFASALVVFLLHGFSSIEFGFSTRLENTFLLNSIAIIGLVWMVNLFNFMDGTDGLAASEGLFVSTVGALVLLFSGDLVTASWLFYLSACLIGFLVWNFPPAKVFMGDSGSSFLGFFFGTVALLSHNSGTTTIWFWLILTGCFTIDATFTIVTRFLNKENVFQAHRTHVFQRIAGTYDSHSKVVFVYLIVNLAWLLPIAIISHIFRDWAFICFVVAYVPLMVIAYQFGAGRVLSPGTLTR